ncbi:MAG: hypothetical protein WCR42_11215 [bacterium]
MNYAQAYKEEMMKDTAFKKAYLEEKSLLDIEFMLDELSEKIKLERSYADLLKTVRKIKRAIHIA